MEKIYEVNIEVMLLINEIILSYNELARDLKTEGFYRSEIEILDAEFSSSCGKRQFISKDTVKSIVSCIENNKG